MPDSNINYKFFLQIFVATVVSLLFQFVFPLWWQPLDWYMHGKVDHFDPGTNIIILTVSLWLFSFSVAWFIDPDNVYINNFLVYSIPSHTMIVFDDIFLKFLLIDYIHILPWVVAIFILAKKREGLKKELFPYYFVPVSIIFFIGYFFDLAYYGEPLWLFFLRWGGLVFLNWLLTFTFDINISEDISEDS